MCLCVCKNTRRLALLLNGEPVKHATRRQVCTLTDGHALLKEPTQ